MTGLSDQVTSRSELTNEMKGLLDQRAARIRQLEKTVKKLRVDISDSALNSSQDLLNISRDTLVRPTHTPYRNVKSICT